MPKLHIQKPRHDDNDEHRYIERYKILLIKTIHHYARYTPRYNRYVIHKQTFIRKKTSTVIFDLVDWKINRDIYYSKYSYSRGKEGGWLDAWGKKM